MHGFLRGFMYAGRGIAAGISGQRNIKVMFALAAAAVILGFVLKITRLEWVLLMLAGGLVLSLELLNTAGEKLIDVLCPDHDPRYGRIKDILAGAVLIAAMAAAVAGALVFWPYLFSSTG